VALARNRDLPANILLFAPLDGRVTVRCNTRPIRAAPLRLLTRRVGKQLQPRQRNGDETEQAEVNGGGAAAGTGGSGGRAGRRRRCGWLLRFVK
jgi:hypothetical protein